MAFPDGWGYKWPIAINADSVISSPVADWPCLITDAHFPAGAWAQMQATGADLRFSLDEAGATELYYDAPRLSVAGASAHLYVAVPSLASTADTTIYGWCGNADATAPSAAWMQSTYPSDWAAFWPMEEGTGTTVGDRTANANHGTLANMDAETDWVQAADGSWALAFDGTSQHIRVPGNAAWGNTPFSITVDYTSTAPKDASHDFLAYIPRGSSGWILRLDKDFSRSALLVSPASCAGGTNPFNANVRRSLTGELNASGYLYLYEDGALISSKTNAPTTLLYTAGDGIALGNTFTGMEHCAAFHTHALTADETAVWTAQASPATFATAGELVAVGGAGAVYRPWLMTGGRMR